MLIQRVSARILFAAGMALLPRFTGAGRIEAARLLILASVYAAVALLATLRVVPARVQRFVDFGFAATLFSLGWLQSFPAWNHSAEIGLYIVFGAVALAIASSLVYPDPERSEGEGSPVL